MILATPLLALVPASLPESLEPPSEPRAALAARDYLLALAPSDAFLVVSFADLEESRAALRKSSWLQFACDDAIASVFEHFGGLEIGLGEEWMQGLAEEGIDPDALLAACTGSAAFFAELPGSDPDAMVLGFLLELGEDRAAFEDLLGTLFEHARAEGATVSGAEYGGAALTVIEAPEGEAGTALVAELGDVVALVGGADRELVARRLHGVVDRWGGAAEGANVLSDETYRAARAHVAFPPQVEVFLDFAPVWRVLREDPGSSDEVPAEVLAELERLQWLNVAGRIEGGETSDFQIALGAPPEGLLGSFASLLGRVPAGLVGRIPRHASSVCLASVDFAGLAALAEDLAREVAPDPNVERGLAVGRERAREWGVELEEDVFSELTGEVATFQVEVPAQESLLGAAGELMRGLSGTAGRPTRGTVLLLGIRDEVKVEERLGALSERLTGPHQEHRAHEEDRGEAGAPPAVREVLGHVVHRVPLVGNLPIALHWAVTDGVLAASLQPSALHEALRMLSPDAVGIRENPRFAEVIEANRDAAFLHVHETATELKAALDALEVLGPAAKLLSMLTGEPVTEMLPFDPNAPWPGPEIVDRYFGGISLGALAWTDGALRLHVASR